MKYAIQYRRMHNGVHGLFIFDKKNEADKAYKSLTDLEYDEAGDLDSYGFILDDILESSISQIEEVNSRGIKEVDTYSYSVNNDGIVNTVTDKIKIVNHENSIDVYI